MLMSGPLSSSTSCPKDNVTPTRHHAALDDPMEINAMDKDKGKRKCKDKGKDASGDKGKAERQGRRQSDYLLKERETWTQTSGLLVC